MKSFSGKALTENLRKLAIEVHTSDPNGDVVTREMALARLIWNYALGWEEMTRDDLGNPKRVVHPPVAWAMQYLFERIEGKAPIATAEQTSGLRAVDKVRQLAKDRLNSWATSEVKGPPAYRKPPTGDQVQPGRDSAADPERDD